MIDFIAVFYYTHYKEALIIVLAMVVFVTKIMVFLLIMAICILLREMVKITECFIKTEHYELKDNKRRWLVWSSISYIIMTIICGIG